MLTTKTSVEGRELLDFIELLGELAWTKFESRRPSFHIKGEAPRSEDRSAYPPFTSFRFKDENPEIIERLKRAVESYKGMVEWVMIEHKRIGLPGTNRVICPKRSWEIRDEASNSGVTARQYMAEHEPEFGPVAYEDLLALTAYVRNIFSNETPVK